MNHTGTPATETSQTQSRSRSRSRNLNSARTVTEAAAALPAATATVTHAEFPTSHPPLSVPPHHHSHAAANNAMQRSDGSKDIRTDDAQILPLSPAAASTPAAAAASTDSSNSNQRQTFHPPLTIRLPVLPSTPHTLTMRHQSSARHRMHSGLRHQDAQNGASGSHNVIGDDELSISAASSPCPSPIDLIEDVAADMDGDGDKISQRCSKKRVVIRSFLILLLLLASYLTLHPPLLQHYVVTLRDVAITNRSPKLSLPRPRRATVEHSGVDPGSTTEDSDSYLSRLLSAAAAAARLFSPSNPSHHAPAQPFKFLIRILSSGSIHHSELDRLLQSLQHAEYDVGIDMIDVEIVVDCPLEQTRPPPLDPHTLNECDQTVEGEWCPNITSIAAAEAAAALASYRALQYEYEMSSILARSFVWVHGESRVRIIEPHEANEYGGFFNQFISWQPTRTTRDDAQRKASVSDDDAEDESLPEWCLVLRDSNVVSPVYFRMIKATIQTYFLNDTEQAESLNSTASERWHGSVIGGVLEPVELMIGDQTASTFDSTRSLDRVLMKQQPSMRKSLQDGASDATSPYAFLAQTLVTFSEGGGLLMRAAAFSRLQQWLHAAGIVRTSTKQTGPAQPLHAPPFIYNDQTSFDPCIPNHITNAWFPQVAHVSPLSATQNGSHAEDVNPPQSDSIAMLHESRAHSSWFTLALLQRWMVEEGLVALHLLWPNSAALISSSAFIMPHSHEGHEHEHEHAAAESMPVDGVNEEENTNVTEKDILEERAWVPLPPLKRSLLTRDIIDPVWLETNGGLMNGSSRFMLPSIVIDAFGELHELDQLSFPILPANNLTKLDLELLCRIDMTDAPPQPPTHLPTDAEREALLVTMQQRMDMRHEMNSDDQSIYLPDVDDNAILASLLGPANVTVSPELKQLSENALIERALRIANVSRDELTAVSEALSQFHDEDGVTATATAVEQSELFAHFILDTVPPFPNCTELAQNEWEEFDADFQIDLQRLKQAVGGVALDEYRQAMEMYDRRKQEHEARMDALHEALAHKQLIKQLRQQLLAIREREIIEQEGKILAAYRKKKKRLQQQQVKQTSGSGKLNATNPIFPAPTIIDPLEDVIKTESEYQQRMAAQRERIKRRGHRPLFLGG